MGYLITHCWYANHLADEVAKKYLETMEKYPPDESLAKTIVPAAVSAKRKGFQKRFKLFKKSLKKNGVLPNN